MNESIIEQSNKSRRKSIFLIFKNKKFLIIIFSIILIGLATFFILKSKSSKPQEIQEKQWTIKKDNLSISVESDGKVVAEDGVELSFSISGDTLEVSNVYVKEGDKIKKGDKIASVKTENLQFDLRNAYASYESALANLQVKQAGSTEEEIAKAKNSIDQAQVSLDQAKISLEQTKSTSEQKIVNAQNTLSTAENNLRLNQSVNSSEIVDNAYSGLVNTIKSISMKIEDYLEDADDILGIDNEYINDDFENLLSVKNISFLNNAQSIYSVSKTKKEDFYLDAISLNNNSSASDIDTITLKVEDSLNSMDTLLYYTSEVLNNTITSADFSQSDLDSLKSSISSDRSGINSSISSLESSVQSVSTAKNSLANYQINYNKALSDLEATKKQAEQDIKNSEASVKSREVSLEQTKISYNETIAPADYSELASARTQLTSASVNLDKAKYNIEKATLTSPIDGEVSQLNYKTGDIIMSDNTDPVAIIINNNTLFIEVNIEESDINKIKLGQKVYATFDALDGLEVDGEVSFISLTSQTDNSGIVTYLVRVILENKEEYQIREGMTAYVDFVTSEVKDVLVVPVSAIKNVNSKVSVKMQDEQWKEVTTVFTDGEYVEVISGLNEGDVILY